VHYGSVWFYGKIERRKENEWMDSISIVWHHQKEERKECFDWPHSQKLSALDWKERWRRDQFFFK